MLNHGYMCSIVLSCYILGVKGLLASMQVGDIKDVNVTEVNESGALCELEEGKVRGFVMYEHMKGEYVCFHCFLNMIKIRCICKLLIFVNQSTYSITFG